MTEKLTLASMDVAEQRRAELKALFPGVFTETENEKGELVESIDFEKLKSELGTFSDVFESRRERYGMDWPGKKDCMKLIQQPSVGTLKPYRDESVNFDNTENLFIEGDNLEVLKLLQKSYYGKVKMVYIDPPYNTGKEFIYPDNYSESLETYLEYAGLADGEGKKFSTNVASEGRFHTRWLNMMYPRLYLARNLLQTDGVMLISIDDNEVTNLRALCDSIFGEDNFLAQFVWNSEGNTDNQYKVKVNHEYILAYYKSESASESAVGRVVDPNVPEDSNLRKGYADNNVNKNSPENPPSTITLPIGFPCSEETLRYAAKTVDDEFFETTAREKYISDEVKAKYGIENQSGLPVKLDDMVVKDGKLSKPCRIYVGMANRKKLHEFISNDCNPIMDEGVPLTFYINRNAAVRYRRENDTPRNILSVLRNLGTTETSKTYLKGMGLHYDYPKPVDLLKYLIQIGCEGDGIVLDFFAGSCTTAEAVLRKNVDSNSRTRFIIVQLPEEIVPDKKTQKAAYDACVKLGVPPRLSEVGKDRIRRVIKSITDESSGQLDLEGDKVEQDLGFKVLKLEKSNFDVWDGSDPDSSPEDIGKQLSLYVDHIDPSSLPEDILHELLLKAGFMPTEKVSTISSAGTTVYSVADGALLICLEEEVTRELIDAVAEAEPMQFICLDKAFKGNDQLKANAVQTFAARNQGRDKAEQIIFRTV